VLRELESMDLPAVRPAGLALQPDTGNALLVTRYLTSSWQYRRLFMRLPPDRPRQRARLLDAMATLLVELHRHGVYWGDCSLANTLFTRDGQRLQAWLVDAETSEVHPRLSDGQRQHDLEILVENVAGGAIDLAMMLGRPPEIVPRLIEEAAGVAQRYAELWDYLHERPLFSFADRWEVEGRIRRLNEMGFAVDEISLEPAGDGDERLRLTVSVAGRKYHSTTLRELTGLDVGEGQAQILLAHLRAYEAELQARSTGPQRTTGRGVSDVAERWLVERLRPGMLAAHAAVGGVGDPVQAYCDLLEVRWLLSEQAGRDVGDDAALAVLADRSPPADSAAMAGVAEVPTAQLPRPSPERLREPSSGPE
jgi:hypothetical protein